MNVGETLSSNTLFHFTSKREYLESIIDNGFHPRYCTEDFSAFAPALGQESKTFDYAVPMVCFCDIPLSKVKEHISVYKGYGIGCSKAWGIDKGITPLIYVKPTSETAIGIRNALVSLRQLSTISTENIPKIGTIRKSLMRLMKYVKPYEGRFEHGGLTFENKRFYDEREWRYIPELEEEILPPVWISKELMSGAYVMAKEMVQQNVILTEWPFDEVRWIHDQLKANAELMTLPDAEVTQKLFDSFRQEMNKKLSEEPDPKMQIDPTSLKYLIVEKDEDVKHIVEKLEKRFEDQPFTVVKRLITRIITLEQINDDF